MATKYAVNAAYIAKYPGAVTLIDGAPVALSGKDLTVKKEGTLTRAPSERVIPGVTQEQLQFLAETERNPHIIKIEEKAGGK